MSGFHKYRSVKVRTRCFHFDEDGRPKGAGCRRGPECRFTHPDDSDWDEARISSFRPNPFHSHHRDDSFERRQSSWTDWGNANKSPSSASHRSRRRSTSISSSSRSYSPGRRERRDSGLSNQPSEASPFNPKLLERMSVDRSSVVAESSNNSLTKMAQSPLPTPTIAQKFINASLPGTEYPPPVLPTPPTTTTNTGDAKMPATHPPSDAMVLDPGPGPSPRSILPTEGPSVPLTPITPIYKPQSPMQPPPPGGSAPLQPPWPVPDPPKVLSHETTMEPSEDDKAHEIERKRALWEERTRLLADAVQARQRQHELEGEIQRAEGITNSTFFTKLSEEERTRLKQQLDAMKLEEVQETAKHDEVMEKLRASDSWPVAPAPDPNEDSEEQMKENHKEIVRYIDELHNTVKAMQRELGSIATLKPPPTLPIEPDEDEKDAMDVDQPVDPNAGPSEPNASRKRRRLSDDVDGEPDLPSRQELDKLLDRLLQLESTTTTLRNDLVEHDRDLQDEFQVALEARLDDFHTMLTNEREEREEAQKEAEQARDRKAADATRETELLGEQVGELAEEMSNMLVRVSEMERELVEKTKERQESYERVLQVEQRLLSYANARQTNTQAIQTLEAALKAYTSRPLSPPASPKFHPSILEYLEEQLVESLRQSVMPLMDEVRKDVETVVQEKNAQLYKSTWETLKFTMNVLTKISSNLDNGRENGPTASTGPTAIAPSAGPQQ